MKLYKKKREHYYYFCPECGEAFEVDKDTRHSNRACPICKKQIHIAPAAILPLDMTTERQMANWCPVGNSLEDRFYQTKVQYNNKLRKIFVISAAALLLSAISISTIVISFFK